MQALLTLELPPPPRKKIQKQKQAMDVENGRVGLSRVAPPSHRQEKSARKECQLKKYTNISLNIYPFDS